MNTTRTNANANASAVIPFTGTRAAVRAALCIGAAMLSLSSTAHANELNGNGEGRASELSVSVTNLTRGTWFAPILVAAHPAGFKGFTEGSAASPELQAMAEIGDIAPLAGKLPTGSSAVLNPAGGGLKPGGTVTTKRFSGGKNSNNTRLSIFAMLVPTNDGFIGLNAIEIPKTPGTYVYTVAGYDAGTEANNEAGQRADGVNQPGLIFPPFLNDASGHLAADINPAAAGFTQATKEGFVHTHRGVVGSDANGPSALDYTAYRWLNPVARITVTVK